MPADPTPPEGIETSGADALPQSGLNPVSKSWTAPEGMVSCEVGPVEYLMFGNWGRLVGHVTEPTKMIDGSVREITYPVYRPCDAKGRFDG